MTIRTAWMVKSINIGRSPEVAWPRVKRCSLLGTLAVGGYGEDAFVQASQATSDGQDHKPKQRARQERDTSGHFWRGPDRESSD